jgi:hypothetical protein
MNQICLPPVWSHLLYKRIVFFSGNKALENGFLPSIPAGGRKERINANLQGQQGETKLRYLLMREVLS